jgi:hypothetical protein
MNISILLKALFVSALTASLCCTAGCERNRNDAGGAANDSSAAARGASAPGAVSFPARAASDAPAGASQ